MITYVISSYKYTYFYDNTISSKKFKYLPLGASEALEGVDQDAYPEGA